MTQTTKDPSVRRLLRKGDECLKSNKLDEALEIFHVSLEMEPKNLSALLGRAAAFYGLGQDQKAQADLNESILLLNGKSKIESNTQNFEGFDQIEPTALKVIMTSKYPN